MKRTLSIILCLVMVLSLVAVSAYAAPNADEIGKVASGYTPEGTGIDSLDKITDPAGKYYLTKDVTAGATLTAEFKGTLDGNGKTITVSAPIFDKLAGTVKNLVIKGAVDTSANAVQAGALSIEKLEAMTCVCSVGLDMIAIPGDTKATTISGMIADEMAIGMINQKTTAVRVIPVVGKGVGEIVEFGGLLGYAPVMPVNQFSCDAFVNRQGRIPAPIHSFKN